MVRDQSSAQPARVQHGEQHHRHQAPDLRGHSHRPRTDQPELDPTRRQHDQPGGGPCLGDGSAGRRRHRRDPVKWFSSCSTASRWDRPPTSPPYTYNWSVGSTAPGEHYLAARATDENGLVGTSAATTVTSPSGALDDAIDHDIAIAGIGTSPRHRSRPANRTRSCWRGRRRAPRRSSRAAG